MKKLAKVIALSTNEKLGVGNIKTSFTVLLELREDISDLIKSWSIAKAIELVFDLADYKSVLNTFKQAWLEFKDLDPGEAKELADHFNEKFNIPNNELEAHIENGIDLIPKTYAHIKDTIKLGGEWSEFFKGFKSKELTSRIAS